MTDKYSVFRGHNIFNQDRKASPSIGENSVESHNEQLNKLNLTNILEINERKNSYSGQKTSKTNREDNSGLKDLRVSKQNVTSQSPPK